MKERFKRFTEALLSNSLFWIFVIMAVMVTFVFWFEKPIHYNVENIYHVSR